MKTQRVQDAHAPRWGTIILRPAGLGRILVRLLSGDASLFIAVLQRVEMLLVRGTSTQVDSLAVYHDSLIFATAVDEEVGDCPEVVVQGVVEVFVNIGDVDKMLSDGVTRCGGVGLTHARVRVALVNERMGRDHGENE